MTRLASFALLLAVLLGSATVRAQAPDPQLEGLWEGYDGEWGHVSRQLVALAEAMPAETYAWRPAPGIRSVGEVLVHVAQSNFFLLSVTGPRMPAEMAQDDLEKTLTDKPTIVADLKRSLAAVREAHARLEPAALERKVQIDGKTVPVEGMYLRLIVHDNEHMGQLIAYARMNGIAPPWTTSGPAPSQALPAATVPPAEHHEHAAAARAETLVLHGAGKSITLAPAELAAMPQTTVTVRNGHTQANETYTGVATGLLLERLGLSTATAAGSKTVYHSYVVARGTDDYTVLFSASELEAGLRLEPAIVALSVDGKPLGEDGAFKLVVPGEKKPARWVRNLAGLTLTALP